VARNICSPTWVGSGVTVSVGVAARDGVRGGVVLPGCGSPATATRVVVWRGSGGTVSAACVAAANALGAVASTNQVGTGVTLGSGGGVGRSRTARSSGSF